MTEVTRISMGTSKSVFTVHGVDASCRAVLRRDLRRERCSASLNDRRQWKWFWKPVAGRITGAVG